MQRIDQIDIDALPPAAREHFEERAAIREFMGGDSREVAEREAYAETVRIFGLEGFNGEA